MVTALRKKGLKVTGWNDWFGSAFMPYIARPYYTDGHPDEIDIKEAKEFGKEILERTLKISKGELGLFPDYPERISMTSCTEQSHSRRSFPKT